MEKDKADKKDHILNIAEAIFSDFGYDGTSTRSISGRAGVNVSMLKYYFGSKEGLFLAVVNRKINAFNENVQHLHGNERLSAWEKLENYIELYTNKVVSNNNLHKLIYNELGVNRRSELVNNLRQIIMKNFDELRKILKDGIAMGDFKPDSDVEMVTATLYGTNGYLMNTPVITSTLMGVNISDERKLNVVFKPRLKDYMKNLLRSYLIENATQ
jgi:TetR/AcrR family transcriptional regulator